jgi:hypothetical protein
MSGARMIALLVLAAATRLNAEHFDIRLTATAGGISREASADQSPPIGGLNARPILKVRAEEVIQIQFIMANVYSHDQAPDAGVRYYVVREREAGQKVVPPLDKTVAEGSFSFNLKPKAKIAGRNRIAIAEPGVYLLRVESMNTQRDHEHFAAIDIVVQ